MSDAAPERVQSRFQRQLTVATLSLLFVVLVVHLLQTLSPILQPLLIAVMVAYVLYPVHHWLVRRGVRPALAAMFMLVALVGLFFGIGQVVYESVISLTPERLETYQARGETMIERIGNMLPASSGVTARDRIKKVFEDSNVTPQDAIRGLRGVAGSFFGFLTFGLVVTIYLVFLIAEKQTLPRRLALAFGEHKAGHLLGVVGNINGAIVRYIAVKTWISVVTAGLSVAVFLVFGVEFAVLWGILIFLFNFVPYLGSLIAMGPPILLAFAQFETIWPGMAVLALLIGVQLFTGQYLEPRLAGRSLNLSPLLILLSLAFWGFLWGAVGMILAVPLTVVIKIVLDSIPETRPVGTLMSNV